MTEPRALEIISAYGADPARWPADERAGVLALAGQPAVARALAEAAALDALLAGWSQDVPAGGIDAAAIAALPQQRAATRPARRWSAAGGRWYAAGGRWYAGGGLAIAASLALVLALPNGRAAPGAPAMVDQPVRPVQATPSAAPAPAASSDTALFASVFTPTADEEDLI